MKLHSTSVTAHPNSIKKTNLTRKMVIDVVSALFILLFVYTSINKLYDVSGFESILEKSPFIGGGMAPIVAFAVPVFEIIVSTLLFFPRYRYLGLYISTALMMIFSLYVAFLMYFAAELPCSCGGVLSSMTWGEHLVFNSVATIIGLVAISLARKQKTSL